MKIRVLKLGTVCKDRATQLEGTLTHWALTMDRHTFYIFQPKGLTEEGVPVRSLSFGAARLELPDSVDSCYENVEVPFEILGSTVTDKASGFTGMAVEFIRHINGCFHVAIQPAGQNVKTSAPVRAMDFDLRQCTGEKIVELSKAELQVSVKERPSPTGDVIRREVPSSINRPALR